MGTYTSPWNLYKADASELVDAETQVNRNLQIVDKYFKGTFDYLATAVESVSGDPNIDKSNKTKYYKSYSNSISYWNAGSVIQDNGARIWSATNLPMLNGWQNVDNSASTPVFQYAPDLTGVVKHARLVGFIRLNNYDNIVPGTSYIVAQLPTGYRPPFDKYYNANVDQNNSIARVQVVASNGNVIVTRFGTAMAGGNVANFISFGYLEWEV